MESYVQSMRKLVGSRRIFLPGVRALIINEAGEVLLQRRTDTGQWGLPGGAVEPGESALEALRREVAEETSLRFSIAEPMALYSGATQQFTSPNGDRIQCFAVAFIIRRWEGVPQADAVEGSELRFFDPANPPSEIHIIHKPTLRDYKRYRGRFLLS